MRSRAGIGVTRQVDGEGGASTGRALDRDPSVKRFDDLFVHPLSNWSRALEPIEDPRHDFGSNPDAAVADPQQHPVRLRFDRDLNRLARPIPNRVGEKVRNLVFETEWVRPTGDRTWSTQRQHARELVIGLLEHGSYHRCKIQLLNLELQFAGGDLRDLQKGINQLSQANNLFAYLFQAIENPLGRKRTRCASGGALYARYL